MSARTILVGDIHGCPDELCELLESVGYAQGVDALVLVGDLVARGPDSRGAIDRAREFAARAVRGNHDEKLLAWWRVRRARDAARADQEAPLGERHRAAAAQLDEAHFEYLDALPLALPLPEHHALVVHAGLDPRAPWDQQTPAILLNVRSVDEAGSPTRKLTGTPWAELWKGPPHVVFGHDARRGLQLAAHATGLDTGCCYGRELTALLLDRGEDVPADPGARRTRLRSVPARRAYCPMGDGSGPE